jgi:hypothetical protein
MLTKSRRRDHDLAVDDGGAAEICRSASARTREVLLLVAVSFLGTDQTLVAFGPGCTHTTSPRLM